ncbi:MULTISPECIES: hypothetical protein [Megasphaera]|jgi:hypothetical protein|uniref:HIRAN domain-containing protein n=1 Tax=Megasphaera intestinihominis TaxID=3133159 RepID=A0ABV1CV81_9FIRM|nr:MULTISPECIES: hypothetical protein [unclassified Megasphaera]EPP15431.1 hypothetical protein G153_10238 [Megasphaera sp. BL7]EPP17866.1 hypothetical protein NM10_06736 [Megasphaera sp. NM10]MBS7221741.1 hypothetical protein [Megasphaera sp.]MCH4173556.1 hypothetical protein [Megasphaera sp.]
MIYSYDGTFFGYLSAVIDRDEALLRKDQAQPAVRADIFDLGQAIVPQRGPAPQLYAQEVLVFSD